MGRSLFVDETLVGKTSIPLDQFIVNEQLAAISENTLSTASGYEFCDAPTGSESFYKYITSFNSKVDALSHAHTDVSAKPSVPTGAAQPIDHASIIKEAILASKTTATKDVATEAQERVLLSWRILFGHFITHPDGSVETDKDLASHINEDEEACMWQHVIDLTGVAVHILHDLQTVFQVIASEAKDFTLHAQAQPLGTIQRAKLFSGARAQTQLLLDKIDEGLRNCRRPNYPRMSALSALISSTAAPDASPSGKRSSESPSSKQDTVASPAKKPKRSNEESTTRGMLICTSTRRPPMPDQKWKVNGVEKTACVNFLFQNFPCTNTCCTLLHLHKRVFQSRPVSEQESFKTWVQSTLNVKWGLLGRNHIPVINFLLSHGWLLLPHQVAAASVSTLTQQVNYYASRPTPKSHCIDPQDECALQDYPPTRTIFDELDPADMLVAERFRHILEQGAMVTPTFTRLEQSHFLRDLTSRTAVESPNGKDSNDRCFKTESFSLQERLLGHNDRRSLGQSFLRSLTSSSVTQEPRVC
ncbi:unnamed protein product [Cylindrotheca closterium]|uniref:Uncharacterized protein n=1 Tax=Cylindrotheca closterium TaxID=2856 RepID=A0AAD2JPL7_9STRA|nr:unnamed protein product [Cylindrotheca closterium]